MQSMKAKGGMAAAKKAMGPMGDVAGMHIEPADNGVTSRVMRKEKPRKMGDAYQPPEEDKRVHTDMASLHQHLDDTFGGLFGGKHEAAESAAKEAVEEGRVRRMKAKKK